ncbi:FmdB family zinc ribbon protein [Microbacterium gubbeenense]|uniref:FmdB family zinc ribbon protein n=1 Tax=Microbacterium gubbeenense TaxID=159896 RepID=UPI003F9D4DB5
MPTYSYACKTCGHAFDAVQSFSEASLTACPECGGALRKEYGSIGVTFNGSGFYRTDSRASASTSTSDSASSTSAAPSAGATSTSSSA